MSNLLKSKFFLGVMVVAVMFVGVVAVSASEASAATDCSITKTLRVGSKGVEVMCLQKAVRVTPDGSFGPMTKAAVMTWQASAGLTPDGVFGPKSNAAWMASMAGGSGAGGSGSGGCTTAFDPMTGLPCGSGSGSFPAGCTSTAGWSPTTGVKCDGSGGGSTGGGSLVGGAGSVEDYNLVSGLNNEEVGENAKDVQVAGLEIEADNGSDLELTAVRLVFDEGTGAASDFEDYADEVSVWLGSTKYATVSGDEFNDDNEWSKTVTLSPGAVVKAGKTAKLYVALSGTKNLDTADVGDEWDVDFTSVRFKDAQGTVISEDPTVAVTTFSFESFAASADTEFKITLGKDDETVNEAHVINVDATDDTDNVPLLSFNVEIEGTSDVNLDDLPVNFDVTGAANVDDMVSGLSLWMDGVKVGSASVGSDCIEDPDCVAVGADETYLFEDMDLDLDAGKDYEFLVKVDLKSTADVDLDVGDTIAANVGETQTDLATFNAEDSSGEDLADADLTGTVTGVASEVRDVGIMVKLIGTPTAVVSHVGDIVGSGAGDDDQGTFTITFDVTSFDGDVYVDGTAPTLTGGATESDLNLSTTGTAALTSATIISPSGATLTGTINADARFKVAEDDTERFTITAVSTVSADGFVKISLGSILYALTDVDGDLTYTFNLDDFKTADLYLNAN